MEGASTQGAKTHERFHSQSRPMTAQDPRIGNIQLNGNGTILQFVPDQLSKDQTITNSNLKVPYLQSDNQSVHSKTMQSSAFNKKLSHQTIDENKQVP